MTPPGGERRGVPASVVAQYTLVVLAILMATLFVWQIRDALLAAFGGVIIAVILTGLAEGIRRFLPLSRGWAITTVCLIALLLNLLMFFLFGSQIRTEFRELVDKLPEQITRVQESIRGLPVGSDLLPDNLPESEQEDPDRDSSGTPNTPNTPGTSGTSSPSSPSPETSGSVDPGPGTSMNSGSARQRPSGTVQGAVSGRTLFLAGTTLLDVLSTVVVVLFTGIFFAINPRLYTGALTLIVTREREERVEEALGATGVALWKWLKGRLVSMFVVGVIITVGLMLIGVPLALILGLIAALFDFVPYIGPIAAFIPAFLLAFAEGPQTALFTTLLYVVVQQLEGNLVTPLIQQWQVSLPPAVVILSIVAFGLVFGVPGVILATPLAVVVMVLGGMLYVEDVLGKKVVIPGRDGT